MKRTVLIQLIVIAIGAVCLCGCDDGVRRESSRVLESYGFNPGTLLAARVAAPPPFLLEYLKKLDNAPEYEPYLPGPGEMASIRQAMSDLPPRHRKLMKGRLIGIYFIKNFKGSGLTEWVVDRDDRVYAVMVFNPSVLGKGISALLTEKERTCFRPDDPSYEITIDCGSKYSGFLYILLHEATHLVDYIEPVTPYTDRQYKRHFRITTAGNDFTRNVWNDYDVPKRRYLFTGKVAFYGLSAPQLNLSSAAAVYAELSGSPFVSLYGSLSWAEDLSELAAFYHLSRVLKQPYTIAVARGGKKILSIYPLNAPEVKKRLPLLKIFYSE